MTPVRLIQLILRDAGVSGVGQVPRAEDNNDVFDTLNMMLDEWATRRWLVYHLVNVSIATTGAQSYTIGTGGNFNTTRPDQVQAAFYRSTLVSPSADYTLRDIGSREDYNRIAIKTVGTWPSWFFYDAAFPLGVFYPWPVPSAAAGELHLSLKKPLTSFADLTTEIAMPPAYLNALRWCGAERVRPMYGLSESPQVRRLAKAALAAIRGPNVQMPRMGMPHGLRGGGSRYNIFSDRGG